MLCYVLDRMVLSAVLCVGLKVSSTLLCVGFEYPVESGCRVWKPCCELVTGFFVPAMCWL